MGQVYPTFREKLVSWALNGGGPVSSEFRCRGLNADYVYNAAHDTLGDVIPSTPYVTEEVVLQSVTIAGGILDAANVDFEEQIVGETFHAILIYLWDTDLDVGHVATYVDQSTDNTLPQLIEQESGRIHWSNVGICKF